MRSRQIILLFLIVLIFSEAKAYAFYTDPGTGTLIWQLLVAAVFGGMFYARIYYRKAKHIISTKKDGKKSVELAPSDDPSSSNTTLEAAESSSGETQRTS